MDNNMEKLMEKQMKWQKITAILLAILVAALLFAGLYVGRAVNELTSALEQAQVFLTEATEKLDTLDVDGINENNRGVINAMKSIGGKFWGERVEEKGKYMQFDLRKEDFYKNRPTILRFVGIKL